MPEATTTPLFPDVRRAYERDRAQLVKRYQRHAAEAKTALDQIEAIDKILSGPEIIPHAPPVDDSAAGAAAETAPATSIAATPAGRIVAEAAFVRAAQQNAVPAHVAADDAGPIPAGMVRR